MKIMYIIGVFSLFTHFAIAQKLDRSQLPKPGPAPSIDFKDPVIYKLKNGINVLVVENHKLPKVSATFSIDAGPVTEGTKAGISDILGAKLGEGTTTKTKTAFDNAVGQLGADVKVNASGGSSSALTRYFAEAFLLMADAIRNPSFPAASFEKLRSQSLTGLKSNALNPSAVSSKMVSALTFGKTHPMGEFATENSISSLTLQDVRDAYANRLTPSRGYLTFVGDISPERAQELAIAAFGNWKGNPLSLPKIADVKNPTSTEINLIDMPNAVQSEITLSNIIYLPLNSPDYHAVLLANQILGGGPDAKLFRNLREKHGFTYGAQSRAGSGRFQTTFTASASVRNEKVDSAVVEFLNEINIMRTQKPTEEILKNAKNLYNGAFALSLENPARTAAFANSILINGLPKDFYRNYLQKINAVTADDILRVSKKYFGIDNSRIIIVGKTAVFSDGLKRLGYRVQRFDTQANQLAGK